MNLKTNREFEINNRKESVIYSHRPEIFYTELSSHLPKFLPCSASDFLYQVHQLPFHYLYHLFLIHQSFPVKHINCIRYNEICTPNKLIAITTSFFSSRITSAPGTNSLASTSPYCSALISMVASFGLP